MNPELPQKPQDESEAQLTALLLGELPHEQAATLHQKLAQNAELAKLYERLKHTINLVRETLATPAAQTAGQPTPLKLSDQRREKLLQHFKTVAPKEFVPPRRRAMPWLVPVGIAAAFMVILGGLFLPGLSKSKSKGQSFGVRTFSLTELGAPAPLAPPVADSARDSRDLNRRLDQLASGVQEPNEGTPIALALQQAPAPAKLAGTAIVLPKAADLADAVSTPAVAEGAQPGFTVSGTTRGFYDDSLGRAGGMGGGGGFGGGGLGGSAGGVRGDTSATGGGQNGWAAAVKQEQMKALGQPSTPPLVADNSSQTLEYKADGIVPTVGPDGAPLPSAPQGQNFAFSRRYGLAPQAAKDTGAGSPYPNNPTIGDALSSIGAETRRLANEETPPPTALPALSATPAPAQEELGKPAAGHLPAAPAPALTGLASVERGRKVAEFPLQAPGTDKAADDLTTGLPGIVPAKPAPDVSNAGELLLKRNLAGLDSANKPADAAVAAGRIAEANPSFSFYMDVNRNPAPATPPVGSRPAQEVELKQALAGESPPPASGSYYGGGAFGGYSSIQKLPNGGDQGLAPARPALRSPKEGGFAGGVGNAALPPAPSGPQEAAVNEAALRQANIDLSKQSDQKALGFDWYLGNSLARNGHLAAQGGTAPSDAGQASIEGKKSEPPPGELAAAPGDIVPLAIKLPAPAFKGMPTDIPVLGDVPAAGRLFRPEAAEGDDRAKNLIAAGAVQLQVEEKAKSMELADYDSERQKIGAEGQAGRLDTHGANVHSLDVVGYADVPLTATNAIAGFPVEPSTTERYTHYRLPSQLGTDSSGAPRPTQSPIVLPAAQSETSLALKDGKDVQLFALASQSGAAPATLEDTRKQGAEDAAKTKPYFEAKRQLEELQRFRQVLDTKIASEKIDVELPKTMMVDIVDRAVPPSSASSTLWDKIRGRADGFKSTARIKLERDAPDIAGLADAQKVTGYDPYFVQTEFETIQSEAILGKVIKDLNLNEAWGKKQGGRTLTTAETMALLKNKLDLRPEQNTSLIDIGVKGDQPEEAAKIANAIAEEYRSHRAEQRAQLSKAGIRAMEERFTEQEQKVREAQKKVDALRVELKIPDAAASGKSTLTLVPTDMAALKPAAPAPIPQPEVQTADNAFSTFSLNVSDVSFKLAAASLEKGVMPEPANVRSEEFINAFDYRDPEPPPGVPVAFAWERAQYPFAQNRDLLRFSIKTAALGRQPGRPLNIVLLLDNSGSMERADRVRIIREALRVLAEQLQPQDKLSVITFARTPRLFADGAPGSDAGAITMALTELTPEGGTNLEDAMNLAYQTALRHYLANGVNRVVLLTDGAANLGNVDPEALKQKVEAHRKQGVALDCFGIGWEGYNDDLLEVLSRNGDGRYAFLNSPEEVASEFAAKLAGALQVAASDVKVQVEFNPDRVTAYRQIGYAKHQLTKEQFRDNTVNAAQIGAAEAGNALYTVEVNPAGTGPLCTVRVRFRIPGTTDYREHAWDVPFTGDAVALEQASPAMRLAATASALSEWLASSPYAGEVTTDRLLGYLSGVPEVYGADARPKKLEWMIRQAKSISGK